jgi:hypothetical protein
MTFTNTIVDTNGNPIYGASYYVYNKQTGERSGTGYETDASGTCSFTATVQPWPNWYLKIEKQGYKTKEIAIDDLINLGSGVKIQLQKTFPFALIAIALIAINTYIKQNKKVGALNEQDIKNIMLATGGILAFSLIKQLLEFLGIWQSREDQQLEDAATNPNSFWNPNFWQLSNTYTYALTNQQAQYYAQQLYESLSTWGDDEDKIKGIFRQMRTQANVSFIAFWFQRTYNKDLLNYLRTGHFPTYGLSTSDMAEINSYISKLPKF